MKRSKRPKQAIIVKTLSIGLALALGLTALAGMAPSEAAPSNKVLAWGLNDQAQLGVPTAGLSQSSSPLEVALPGPVVSIATGGGHSLALVDTDGDGRCEGPLACEVWAWGKNKDGQLGNGENVGFGPGPSPRPNPVPVCAPSAAPVAPLVGPQPACTSDRLAGIIAVAAGGSHSLALKADGTVMAWGSNVCGQLGDVRPGFTNGANSIPTPVAGLSDVAAISAGRAHNLALKKDGILWAWGDNQSGQLGNGYDPDGTTNSLVSCAGFNSRQFQATQVLLPDGSSVAAFSAGGDHSLAVTGSGVFAWGNNCEGQLGSAPGVGVQQNRGTPLPVLGLPGGKSLPTDPDFSFFPPGTDFVVGLSAGGESRNSGGHSLALTKSGKVFAWGLADALGAGPSEGLADSPCGLAGVKVQTTPQVVKRPDGSELTGVSSIESGTFHSLAINSDSEVFAWGRNNKGQLGLAAPETAAYATRTLESKGKISMVSASSHSMALSKDAPPIIKPPAPTGLQATAGDAKVTLSWNASGAEGDAATGYNLYRGTTSGSTGSQPFAGNVSATSYTDSAVQNGTRYFYKVTAANSAGESPRSDEVFAAPTAPAPPPPPAQEGDPPPAYPGAEQDPRTPPGFQPGDLDPSFNPCAAGQSGYCDGSVTTSIPGQGQNRFRAYALAHQPDGKIVVAGGNEFTQGEGFGGYLSYFALARYLPSGALDESFGRRGIVTTRIAVPDSPQVVDYRQPRDKSVAHALVIQPDGKIVAAGMVGPYTTPGAESSFALARYLPDGRLDPGFGSAGTVITGFGEGATFLVSAGVGAVAYGLAIQPDGKIVAGGAAKSDTTGEFALARYQQDGKLDQDFGIQGRVTTNILDADASLGGSVSLTTSAAHAISLQPDGKILAAGISTSRGTSGDNFALARYLPNGQLDSSHLSCATKLAVCTGTTATDLGGEDGAKAMALQADGKVLVGGYNSTDHRRSKQFALARYNPDLSLDSGFNPCGGGVPTPCGGALVTSFAPRTDSGITSVAVYPAGGRPELAGRIVVGGYAGNDGGTGVWPDAGLGKGYFIASARYLPDGRLDPAFGEDKTGKVATAIAFPSSVAQAAAMEPNGDLTVAGFVADDPTTYTRLTNERFAVARFRPDGRLDPAFGEGGGVVTRITLPPPSSARASVLQSDGKIIVAGLVGLGNSGEGAGSSGALARYLPDGRLDTTFNPCTPKQPPDEACGGMVASPMREALGVAIQHDGKIVVVGGHYGAGGTLTVARHLRNGKLDTSFGDNGVVRVSPYCYALGNDVAIQPDGKIVIAGLSLRYNLCDPVPGKGSYEIFEGLVVRLLPDGKLDNTFGSGGMTTTATGPLRSLKIYPDGGAANARKIVAGGVGSVTDGQGAEGRDFGFVRLDPYGALDPTFGQSGIVKISQTPDPLVSDTLYGLALQPDGRIVGVGGYNTWTLARVLADGSADASFNPCPGGGSRPACGGVAITPFSSDGLGIAQAKSTVLQPDGKIIVGGFGQQRDRSGTDPSALSSPKQSFNLARYLPDGNLDTGCGGFGGGDGTVTSELGYSSTAENVALQPDGKILVAGYGTGVGDNATPLGCGGGCEGSSVVVARYFGGRSQECGLRVTDTEADEPLPGSTSEANFTVNLVADLPTPVSVSYATSDGAAKAGVDYQPASGRLVFGPGERSKQVSVRVLSNKRATSDQTFTLRLSDPAGAPIVRAVGTATIHDLTTKPPAVPSSSPAPSEYKGTPAAPSSSIAGGGPQSKDVPGLGLKGGFSPARASAIFPVVDPPPAPIPVSQAQGQSQAQQQMQQQTQAQLMVSLMSERQKQAEVAKAGTDSRDLQPDTFLAAGRSRTGSTQLVVSLAAAFAFVAGLGLSRRNARGNAYVRPFETHRRRRRARW